MRFPRRLLRFKCMKVIFKVMEAFLILLSHFWIGQARLCDSCYFRKRLGGGADDPVDKVLATQA